jgi:hypothetical protein
MKNWGDFPQSKRQWLLDELLQLQRQWCDRRDTRSPLVNFDSAQEHVEMVGAAISLLNFEPDAMVAFMGWAKPYAPVPEPSDSPTEEIRRQRSCQFEITDTDLLADAILELKEERKGRGQRTLTGATGVAIKALSEALHDMLMGIDGAVFRENVPIEKTRELFKSALIRLLDTFPDLRKLESPWSK